MLSIDTIARVAVNAVRSAAQPTSFDTGLLLAKDSSFAASKRLKSYANSSEAAAGTHSGSKGLFQAHRSSTGRESG